MGEIIDFRKDMRQAVEARKQEMLKKAQEHKKGSGGGGDIPSKFVFECLRANELGDGMLYAELHRGKYIYNKAAQEWLVWRGHYWERDVMDETAIAVENVAQKYLQERAWIEEKIGEAAKAGNKDEVKRLEALIRSIERRVDRLRSNRGRNNTLQFAHTCQNALAIKGDELDLNPWLLACKNGVIDLRTGKFRPGRQEDWITKASPIEWTGLETPAPAWEKFLLEIQSDRKDVVAYMQRLFGYAIAGLTSEHILPVLYGQGRNGKSVLVETICYVLGSLAGPIQSELLLDQGKIKSSSGPSPDIMSLRGLRIAIASETDEGRKISSAQVKKLTGGDTLRGRNPHDKYEIAFQPTHTLFLLTNHKPHAPADDFAFWERVHLIPFLMSFVDRKPEAENERPQDKKLPEKLRAEASGILAWLVRGCLLWQEQGLNPPPIVKEATREYRRDEDLLADFIEECCFVEPTAWCSTADIYPVFEEWWEENIGKRVPSKKKLGTWLAKKFQKEKKNGSIRYLGIGVLSS